MRFIFLFTTISLLSIFISCNTNLEKEFSTLNTTSIPVLSNDSTTNYYLKTSIESEINKCSNQKAKYLKFLYAYMPLNDRVDYPFSYYSNLVDYTIEARNNFSWGTSIPDNIFNHFVLPYRVNNENLDTSRQFFYHQLKDRIIKMNMLDAALEVNHWCHEHVAYQASDIRTSAPLATYRKGYGRCGEESTFTVAALRSVGIPARQVYTPRWAHTDDNHAWVEFWADGKWYFYGACEPVPEANMGWFTEPARRAMLVVSRIYGPYNGKENILYKNSYRSSNNSLYVYAPVKKLYIKVVDKNNVAVKGAKVDFQIYNYAEFYSLYSSKTDKDGLTSFETGLGDMLVWAHTDSTFAYKMIRNNGDTFSLVLDKFNNESYTYNLDYNPPIKPEPRPVNKELADENKNRLDYEDSLRMSFENEYIDSINCAEIANKNKINAIEFWSLIQKSRANWNELVTFVNKTPSNLKERALDILKTISLKDLQDCKADILLNHLSNSIQFEDLKEISENDYIKYVLNPRISSEYLWPWRNILHNALDKNKNPQDYYSWIKNNVAINDSMNYSGVQINPASVFKYRIADNNSRDILFIALCRANGIPAKIEEGTLLPKYFKDGKWNSINFNTTDKKVEKYGYLHLQAKNKEDKLLYYKHFTIAKFENGIYRTLEFNWDKNINSFDEKIKLAIGNYRLCTGNRLADGSVLSQFYFFNITENNLYKLEVALRTNTESIKKLGTLNDVDSFAKNQKKNACTISNKTYKILVWYNPNNEPSKHAIEDIAKAKYMLNKNNTELWLISEVKYQRDNLDPKYFSQLLNQTFFYTDKNNKLLKTTEEVINSNFGSELPYVILLNPKNEIIFKSEGYSIGLGEDINKVIEKELQ
jgi:hypothetical protein